MCCCCALRVCLFCTCLILVVITIGLFFGFGVYKHGFHKIQETLHVCDPNVNGTLCRAATGRPFLGYYYHAPPPF
ncbi:hypothetical protein Tsubulata_011330 [Turnera subulata]|uniref:Uncharacterized protein n=1 Tax=Turnera subulata TaxID=218843 RepID=A0A9Q0FVB1_9ROSI|nr:hypothetical protein Tsubulata_011195 [Turnera subulata]KAJ4838256.1 hypothetical protein Tsubulata_011330 [Turnera subulata]